MIKEHSKGGAKFEVRRKLKALRDKRLAHYDTDVAILTEANGKEIESFYQDMSQLIALLLSVAKATAYDPAEAADVYRTYAEHFWASVGGARSE